MAAPTNSNLALLIDGDNVTPKIIAGLMAEIASYGTCSARRIYGDWTSPSLKSWKACLLNHSITPIQQFAYTTGKNSTDGAMIIDAMDLLYTGRFAGFCLVSSDSDFTRLAARIREQGVTVYGFGERKTTTAFIAACDKFVYFDVLKIEPDADADRAEADEESLAAAAGGGTALAMQSSAGASVGLGGGRQAFSHGGIAPGFMHAAPARKPLDQAAIQGLATAVMSVNTYSEDWVNLAELGAYLNKISPDLHARNYGYERLREFVEASGIMELKYKNMGDKPPICLARLRKDLTGGAGSPFRGVSRPWRASLPTTSNAANERKGASPPQSSTTPMFNYENA